MDEVQNENQNKSSHPLEIADELSKDTIIKEENGSNPEDQLAPTDPENPISPSEGSLTTTPEEKKEQDDKIKKQVGRPPGKKTAAKPIDPFKNMIPAANRVHIFKITGDGKTKFVDHFSHNDLARFATIEEFLREFVTPEHGDGSFFIKILDPSGKVMKHGEVSTHGKLTSPESRDGLSTKDLMEMYTRLHSDADSKANNQVAGIVGVANAIKEMSGGKQDNSMMMPMMMMMMMQQNQQPQKDPNQEFMMQMIMKVIERLEKQDSSTSLSSLSSMPFLPPTSQPDNSVADVIKAIGEIAKLNQPPQQNLSLDKVIELLLGSKKEDKTLDDLMKMKELVKPTHEGTSDLKSLMDTFVQMEEIREKVFKPDDGGLVQSLAGIASEFVNRMPRQPEQNQQTQQARTKIPQIPPEFRKYVLRINKAVKQENEKEVAESFMKGLVFLRRKDEQWAIYIEKFLEYSHLGNKEKALELIEIFLRTFVGKRIISQEVSEEVSYAVEQNWDGLMVALGFKQPEEIVEEEIVEEESEANQENANQQMPIVNGKIEIEDEDAPISLEDAQKRHLEIQQKEQESKSEDEVEKSE